MAGSTFEVFEVSSDGADQKGRILDSYSYAMSHGGLIVNSYSLGFSANNSKKARRVLYLEALIPDPMLLQEIDIKVFEVTTTETDQIGKIKQARKDATELGGVLIARHTLSFDAYEKSPAYDALYIVAAIPGDETTERFLGQTLDEIGDQKLLTAHLNAGQTALSPSIVFQKPVFGG